jgi:hypothetical protein
VYLHCVYVYVRPRPVLPLHRALPFPALTSAAAVSSPCSGSSGAHSLCTRTVMAFRHTCLHLSSDAFTCQLACSDPQRRPGVC